MRPMRMNEPAACVKGTKASCVEQTAFNTIEQAQNPRE